MSKGPPPTKILAPKTKTQPDSERDGFYEGPDPITWLHVVGTGLSFKVPRKKTCTLGASPKNDIVVQTPYMSGHHCTLTRLYDGLSVEDHSKNGTWVDHRAAKDSPREVRPGGTFVADRITFLALNDSMHAAFPTLSDILGWEEGEPFTPAESAWPTPSSVTIWASGTENLLITGPRGCGQERLAETIHAISPMRDKKCLVVESVPVDRAAQRDLLVQAQKTTVVLVVDAKTKLLDATFASMLFSPSYRIRVLVSAPSFDAALKVLGPKSSVMRRVDLRPLAFRPDQLPRVLDRELEKIGSPLRFDQLTKHNREVLLKNEWRRNLDDVVLAAPKLAEVHRTGKLRQAALALGIKNFNNLQSWFSVTMKLELPLAVER
jgi:energy-coupling factor transporter ATP-binding protein EcfA2